jgi:hypothetical protein
MAFDLKGWRRGPDMGAIGFGAGSMKSKHFYVTNDDAATIQTANYFNPLAAQVSRGDVFEVSVNIATAPVSKSYVVTSAQGAAVVTVALQTTT